jgi:type II secretory pathway component PulJ
MGFLIGLMFTVLLFCLILPIIGMMYFDIQQAKQETKQQYEKVEKLRKQLDERLKDDRTGRDTEHRREADRQADP